MQRTCRSLVAHVTTVIHSCTSGGACGFIRSVQYRHRSGRVSPSSTATRPGPPDLYSPPRSTYPDRVCHIRDPGCALSRRCVHRTARVPAPSGSAPRGPVDGNVRHMPVAFPDGCENNRMGWSSGFPVCATPLNPKECHPCRSGRSSRITAVVPACTASVPACAPVRAAPWSPPAATRAAPA